MQRKPLVWIGGRRRQLPTGDTLAGAEPPIEAGDAQQYYRGDKTWSNLASAVRSVVLTGLSTATNAAIVATDTILQALGKLQAQLNAKAPLDSPEFSPFVKVTNAGNSGFALRNSNLSLPNYSSLIFGPPLDTDEFGRVSLNASANGGVAFNGFTNAANAAAIPLTFIGYHGHTSPTVGAIEFWGWKHNGATSRTTLADNEILWQVRNGTTQRVRILGDGTLLPVADNASDLGLSTNRFRTVYTVTLKVRFPEVIGNGSGNANIATQQFFEADGTTRKGFIGDASSGNSDFYVGADAGNVQLWVQGTNRFTATPTGATVNGTLVVGGLVNAQGLSPVVTVSGTALTFSLGSAGAYHRFTAGSNATCTVPANASVPYPIGSELHIRRAAAANLTIVAASGVTINAPSGGTLVLANNMSVTLKKVPVGTDTWDLIGQTVPA